ncbi:MAG TPA: 1,4-dihydroxy-2-naphthoate polyprenyltransferase [Opitutaceae bacterium]|nr:1,4-dihydroxy-2-naphthoate polyprenyltransferase [Opitutaceae bacterium]
MTPGPVQIWVAAARPRTLPAAVAPVIVGSALAWHAGRFDAGAALLCLGFALLVQVGTNFANDYYDFVKGADTAARVGPRRAVAAGWVAPAVMRRAMILVFAAAFLLGLSLIHWGGPWLLAVGVASIASGLAYTGGPWPLGYHGLGDLFVFIFFGLVAVCATYYVQAGEVSRAAVVVAVPIGLLAANILVVNNYRDAATDALAGKRTLVVRFGRGFARTQFGLSLLVAGLVPVLLLLRGYSPTVLLPWLLLPWAWRDFRRLGRENAAPAELIGLLGDTGRLLALYALLFGAGLALSLPGR